jgi:hypothetical protein
MHEMTKKPGTLALALLGALQLACNFSVLWHNTTVFTVPHERTPVCIRKRYTVVTQHGKPPWSAAWRIPSAPFAGPHCLSFVRTGIGSDGWPAAAGRKYWPRCHGCSRRCRPSSSASFERHSVSVSNAAATATSTTSAASTCTSTASASKSAGQAESASSHSTSSPPTRWFHHRATCHRNPLSVHTARPPGGRRTSGQTPVPPSKATRGVRRDATGYHRKEDGA